MKPIFNRFRTNTATFLIVLGLYRGRYGVIATDDGGQIGRENGFFGWGGMRFAPSKSIHAPKAKTNLFYRRIKETDLTSTQSIHYAIHKGNNGQIADN